MARGAQPTAASTADRPILTAEQELAVLALQRKLDALQEQRSRLGGERAVLRWFAVLALSGPAFAVVLGGRGRTSLEAEVGEVGAAVAIVGFFAAIAWVVRDHWHIKSIDRESRRHYEALRLLGLLHCGRTGYGSQPSYLIWRSNGEQWVPSKEATHLVAGEAKAVSGLPGRDAVLADGNADRVNLSLSKDQQDCARGIQEALAQCAAELSLLGGWRAALRRSLVITLPLGIYWMTQDPQYYTVKKLFGEAAFGVTSMSWIASLVWLIADERKARELRRRRDSMQKVLRELGC